jgi:hypothetical protein
VHHPRMLEGRTSVRTVASTSPYWRVIGRIIRRIHGLGPESENWSSLLTWSNLYKVAPAQGGNPSGRLMAAQFEKAYEILCREITGFVAKMPLRRIGNWNLWTH